MFPSSQTHSQFMPSPVTLFHLGPTPYQDLPQIMIHELLLAWTPHSTQRVHAFPHAYGLLTPTILQRAPPEAVHECVRSPHRGFHNPLNFYLKIPDKTLSLWKFGYLFPQVDFEVPENRDPWQPYPQGLAWCLAMITIVLVFVIFLRTDNILSD